MLKKLILKLIEGKWFYEKELSEMTTQEKYEAYRILEFYMSNKILRPYIFNKHKALKEEIMRRKRRKKVKGTMDSLFSDIP